MGDLRGDFDAYDETPPTDVRDKVGELFLEFLCKGAKLE